jgi:hypothetical protein
LQYWQHMNDDIFSDWNDFFFSHYTPLWRLCMGYVSMPTKVF